ncbi:MAG TPA: hypothetical protein PLD38_15970, partial [Pyrinomonadaceae bacterium]|nr:hypothetical protein [Pyrinomonadaceae bacterium]
MLKKLGIISLVISICALGFALITQRTKAGKATNGQTVSPTTVANEVNGPVVPDDKRGDDKELPEAVIRQIEAMRAEKRTRTKAERKVDSNLLLEIKARRGERIAGLERMPQTGVSVSDDGYTDVEIRADVTDGLIAQLTSFNATIKAVVPQYRSVTARIPIDSIDVLSQMEEVY